MLYKAVLDKCVHFKLTVIEDFNIFRYIFSHSCSNTYRFNIIIFKRVYKFEESDLEFGKVKLRRTIQLKGHRMKRGENIWEEKISPVRYKVENQDRKRKIREVGKPDRWLYTFL